MRFGMGECRCVWILSGLSIGLNRFVLGVKRGLSNFHHKHESFKCMCLRLCF